ncbi:LOW QUALITY PROTEIN: hypothetical protein MAR_006374 [Mya arenaria]|uniref:Uncharacterized protein n=1 Tax=Mya arenaria TaxID=6604 RepID=A0ABY7D9E2_MYAAR|nr:LOW QUALITY PROTEIN: hypothetical protein MAR_006374 [Mya arenaria]
MAFQHPFTMTSSGPTACGKTTFVTNVLQHHSTRIQPKNSLALQEMAYAVFNHQNDFATRSRICTSNHCRPGINLEEDDFFTTESTIYSLLICFLKLAKINVLPICSRVGSHLRSLSVVSINQNLFGNKNPTQRRNCHYLVLFNNHVDRHTVMKLAHQIYPGQTEKFMKAFAKATKYPYEYLLIYLKPFTHGDQR